MIIELDQGNTRVKWRMRDGDQVYAQGGVVHGDNKEAWLNFGQQLHHYEISEAWLASVAKSSLKAELVSVLEHHVGKAVHQLVSQRRVEHGSIRLVNSYQDPRKMGVDRWLAMLAAVDEYPKRAIIIADAGTALNVEIISPHGIHCGGYIVPGLSMMQSSLLSNTGEVRVDRNNVDHAITPGRNTHESVAHGAVASAVGLIEQAHQFARRSWPQGQIIQLLTGGNATVLQPHLPNATIRENLVLDGISLSSVGGLPSK